MDNPNPTQQARVIAPDETREYYFKEGCHILELNNDPDDPALSIARARVAPGHTTRKHHLAGITERYVILSGQGRVFLDGVETRVAPGSVVCIPPGVCQNICNTGAEDLVFLALCTPRFTPECYQELNT